jgi:hypothetical protein
LPSNAFNGIKHLNCALKVHLLRSFLSSLTTCSRREINDILSFEDSAEVMNWGVFQRQDNRLCGDVLDVSFVFWIAND